MSRNGRWTPRWCVWAAALLVAALVLATVPVGAAGGVRYVDKYVARNCQGKTPCYHTIQAAVNNAQPGDTIYVFPATYEAGVNLNNMDPQGDIALVTVDVDGNPTPGTVMVDNPGDAPEIYTGGSADPPFNGDVTIDGFVLRSEYSAIDVRVGAGYGGSEGAEVGIPPTEPRDIEIRNVDASNTGGDGIAASANGNVTITNCTTNNNRGPGIIVWRTYGNVTITGCTSNGNECPATTRGDVEVECRAYGIGVLGADGQVKIRNSTANNNEADGILVGYLFFEEAGTESVAGPDKVTIDRCTTNNNEWEGITVQAAEGDVTITDCTTNGNDNGVAVGGGYTAEAGVSSIDGGDVTIKNCTSVGNDGAGFDTRGMGGGLSIQSCIARNNGDGVDLSGVRLAESVLVNGSVICGNECGVYLGVRDLSQGNGNGIGINLEGNWWGCGGGPEAGACDPICEDEVDSIAVDFTPWIAKISDTASVDPVTVGQPTVVSFQFRGGPPAVYLGQGPGDLRGPAPFTVSTDNGTLNGNGATVEEFINAADGVLELTLVPAREGTATVTVSGPCGLSGLPGNTIVLDVVATQWEFVPEPGSVMLLAGGLMGLAGYAGLRLRKR